MFKKFATFIALVFVLAPVSNVLAATRTWDDGGVGNDWGTAANWSLDTEPTAADTVYLNGIGDKITDVTQAGEVCDVLRAINEVTATHTLNIKSGGHLDADNTSYFVISGVDDSFLTVNIESGGKLSFSTANALGIRFVHPKGTQPAAQDQVCTVNMKGGILDVKTALEVSRASYNNTLYHGEIHLNSGTIYCGSFFMEDRAEGYQDDSMDVGAGVLYVKGDVQDLFTNISTGYISLGLITPQTGYASVVVTTEELSSPLAGSGLYTKVYATPIPEPGTMVLAGFGVLLLLVTRRKR